MIFKRHKKLEEITSVLGQKVDKAQKEKKVFIL